MEPKTILRLEGFALFAVATAVYFILDAPLWLFVVLALAPDLSMVGYLAGARVGSSIYNAFHTYLAPITIGAVGLWFGVMPLVWVALVWSAHIGIDRAVGYGLKYPTGFKDTHLSEENDHPTPIVGPADPASDAVGAGDA